MAEIRTPPVTGIKDSEQVPGTLKPTVIKNPVAYFSRMIQNLDKNEYRANDNFYNHISSIGDGGDLQRECMKSKSVPEQNTNAIERQPTGPKRSVADRLAMTRTAPVTPLIGSLNGG